MKFTGLLSGMVAMLFLLPTQASAENFFLAGQAIRVADNSLDPAKIRAQAGKIKEMKALLSDPDQTVRLSALGAMLKSDSASMREIAYEYAFSSPDYAMRALGLRERIRNMKIIIVELGDQEGRFTIEIHEFKDNTGQLDIINGKGQVGGLEFTFETNVCVGRFQLEDGAILKGSVVCRPKRERQVATIKLQ